MELVKNPLGYFEIQPKPTADDLKKHYRNKYFARGDRQSQYAYEYTEEELAHKAIAAEEARKFSPVQGRSLLEIGFGEGFFLNRFRDFGWSVTGVDFTDEGLMAYFPELRNYVTIGDVYDYLDTTIESDARYDLVVCNNVLEHVLDPERMVRRLQKLLTPAGVCRIVVPNDGSWLQQEVSKRGYGSSDFWLHPPEHLNYFTIASLEQLLRAVGWEVVEILAEFPIDLFLLNADSNYLLDMTRGRNCHFARVAFEMTLFKRSLEELIAFRRGCARAGVGRDTIAYVRKP